MIVLPVEKRFDWKHAPIVMFAIVLVNFAVFFFYQTADQDKTQSALEAYWKENYLSFEWPLFREYLNILKDTELLEQCETLYELEQFNKLTYKILQRGDFFRFLVENGHEFIDEDQLEIWRQDRSAIQGTFDSITAQAFGLKHQDYRAYSVITYQFIHANIPHLLGNCLFLILFGFAVEAAIGHKRFLAFYLISGVVAGMAHMFFVTDSLTPLIGASGAVAGVMAMYLVVFRLRKIEFFYWLFFVVGYFRAPALWVLPFFIGKELASYFLSPNAAVGFIAHVGGFVGGTLTLLLATSKNHFILNRQYIENDILQKEDRETLNEIYQAIERFHFEKAKTVLDEFIEKRGDTLGRSLTRYDLMKLLNHDTEAAALKVFHHQQWPAQYLLRMGRIWLEQPAIHKTLADDVLLQFAHSMVRVDQLDVLRSVFAELQRRGLRHSSMGIFSSRLERVIPRSSDVAIAR